ncbi:MAG: glycosyltransferase family 1 protein [Acidobacteria bacterium]|nr:MAG: glycosyltransferase family 1 protein [Acidobacteriota bacterium]
MNPRRLLHRLRHLARAVALRLRPRYVNDVLKRVLARWGLLDPYWHARAFVLSSIAFFTPRRIANSWRFARRLRADQLRRRREMRLTVAVDVSALWEPLTGIGWYLYRLLEALAPRDDLRLRLYGPDLVATPDLPPPVVPLPRGPAIEVVRYAVPHDLNVPYVRMVRFLRNRQARLIAADRNRLLFAPNYFLPPSFAAARGRLVATVHDLSFLRVPWTLRETTRRDLETHLKETVARAALVLTDAETVRRELIDSGLVPAARVRAVHLGPGSVGETAAGETSLPPGTPPRYALHVGTLEPRKNLPTLFAAWRLLRRRWPQAPPLVLCGRFGWKTERLSETIDAGRDEGWLHHFGYLEDPQVAALYRGAQLVVVASIYEGFGLPAVEAMRCGVPLLLSDIPVLREVAGEAAEYAPAGEPEAWAEKLHALLKDGARCRELAQRGRERGTRFTWRRTADETVAAWRQAAGHAPVATPQPAGAPAEA